MDLLRIALRLRIDRDRERIDHQAEQNEVMKEAADLLGSEPVDVGELVQHGLQLSCFCSNARLRPISTGMKMSRPTK